MEILELINSGSRRLQNKNICSHKLDSEILLSKVLNKTINLKPVEYYLEGRRVGYKTKLLKINILMDQKSINIEVICDEPI